MLNRFFLTLRNAGIPVTPTEYLSLLAADPLFRLLGQTGVNVVTRILGILLAALAIQYVADGARGLWLVGR